LDVLFQGLKVLFVVFVEKLYALFLGGCLEGLVLLFGEITGVLEDLNERFLFKCFAGGLFKWADSFDGLIEEFFF